VGIAGLAGVGASSRPRCCAGVRLRADDPGGERCAAALVELGHDLIRLTAVRQKRPFQTLVACACNQQGVKMDNVVQKPIPCVRSIIRRILLCPKSARSTLSIASAGSILSIGSAGSLLSVASTGSILSIGSAGSVLSIGGVGSVLSIASVGSILSVLSAGSCHSLLSVGSVLSKLSYRAIRNQPRSLVRNP
jgi:hypothetical protein